MEQDRAWLLAQEAELLSIRAEIEGMVALNQYRMGRDETIAYDDTAFAEVSHRCDAIYHRIMESR